MVVAVILLFWMAALAGLLFLGRHLALARRGRERIFEGAQADATALSASSDEGMSFLRRWLFRAGYRNPSALLAFNIATIAFAGLGMVLALVLYASGLIERGLHFAGQIPGGVGDLMVPIIYLAPWTILVILASLPTLMVRAARRRRVAEVEQDLPITLELLATLSEAGLGFDAALERILQTQSTARPLAQEFRILQVEILAGRPRIHCLRRLSWRVETMSLTIFVSALVQTEQVGAGVSDVLRRQADDLRGRRRENALALAAALPVKLLFPLVICFMPGILLATLGPTFYQIFQFLDNLSRHRAMP
jgi:tight adherence protein C